jgi:hypothetical protein
MLDEGVAGVRAHARRSSGGTGVFSRLTDAGGFEEAGHTLASKPYVEVRGKNGNV